MLRLNLIASEMTIGSESVPKGEETPEKPLKRITDWIQLLKKFTEKHREKCCDTGFDVKLRKTTSELKFLTGARYRGQYNAFGINGKGTYTFPNGVIYEGDFVDGMFYGKGSMKFPCGTVLRGPWIQGLVIEPAVVLQGELHHDEDMRYCVMPDRRFCVERKRFIQPAGKSYLTNDQPTREVPHGYYDVGNGFFDPVSKDIFKYEDRGSVKRAPNRNEQRWIMENCRDGCDGSVGPAMHLYEQFAEIKMNLYDESPYYGMSGLMDYHDPEMEDRMVASRKLLEKRILPKGLPNMGRRFTIRDFQEHHSRILS